MNDFNSTSATVYPSRKDDAKNFLSSYFTFGPMDFWEIDRNGMIEMDRRFGENNVLGNPYYSRPFAVTLGSNLKKFSKKPSRESIFSKVHKDIVVNWGEASSDWKLGGALIAILGTFVSTIVNFSIGFSFIHLAITLISAFLLVFILAMISGNGYRIDLRGNKRWKFPVDEGFIVLQRNTALHVMELLKENQKNPNVGVMVRSKLELDRDHESVTQWVKTVRSIFQIDNDFPVDMVPFVTAHAKEVLRALKAKIGLAKAVEMNAVAVYELTPVISGPLSLLPTNELRSKLEMAHASSESALFSALSHIEFM